MCLPTFLSLSFAPSCCHVLPCKPQTRLNYRSANWVCNSPTIMSTELGAGRSGKLWSVVDLCPGRKKRPHPLRPPVGWHPIVPQPASC
ncbi:hypothetical protein EDC01DRAFT_645934 [Geopyxis carbonaria]|nr:hypothetical protein EDC01DRAFT_645934 [Geopyxis carbonaria]